MRRPLDTTERVIARCDADVSPRAIYRWVLTLFREHAPPGAARFRVRTWTPQGRPIRGVVCGRGYDAPAPVPSVATPAADTERRRALARAEAAEARVAALEAELAARRAAPMPTRAPASSSAAQERRLSEQAARIRTLEREQATLQRSVEQEKARAQDWHDRALGLAVRVGRFAKQMGLGDDEE